MRLFGWLRRPPAEALPQPTPEALSAYHALFGAGPREAAPAKPVAKPAPVAVVAAPEPAPPPPPPSPPVVEIRPSPEDARFRTPPRLSVTDLPVKHVLIIGSCMSGIIKAYFGNVFPGVKVDHILYNHAGTLPPETPLPLEDYEFQLIMLALRTAMPEQLYFRLAHDDVAGHEAAFVQARERLIQMLHGALEYREKRPLMTFVTNYALPQQNSMGRLLPRYDLRNPVYFVEQLNRVIADEIAGMPNVHLVDIDQVSANFGRKYLQDDVMSLGTHNSVLNNYEHELDQQRIEKIAPPTGVYESRVAEFVHAVGFEIKAMHRTLRQVDQVKLVIVDLDDTMWRGVVAEEGIDRPGLTEGWPIGVAEALIYLKRRGVLLAIVSKNDEARIRELWPRIYGSRLELSDFASVKINWNPKADNVELILKETNLLPRSVVFVDDNPVERENVASAFPGIRLLGSTPYEVRRILLWSAETQVAQITAESARRTEMVQAQVERETTRSRLSRAEFLETLDVRIRLYAITDQTDPRFARALELVNKSNQFNTTGRRWTQDECQAAFGRDTVFWAFEVDDRFTSYGVVGVAIATRSEITQFVMSCRVIGLEVEIAAVGALVEEMVEPVTARFTATDANFLCKDLFARCGFVEAEGGWAKPAGMALPRPAHIRALERHGMTMAG